MTAYEVTSNHVPPYAGSGLPVTEVLAILHRLDPAAIQEAGAAHTTLGRELDTMAADLTGEAHTLAQSWSGTAARTAQAQFQRLREQTATLSAQATQTGAVLTWLGTQVLPSFKDLADPAQAQQYLTELSSALILANRSLPAQIGGAATAQVAPAPAAGASGPGPGPASPGANVPGGPVSPTSLSGAPGGQNNPGAPGNADPTNTISPSATASPAGASGHAAPTASRLQSAAPVPASGTPATPAAPATPSTPAAATTGSPAPVPLVTTASPRTTGTARRRRPASDHDSEPSAEGTPAAHAAGLDGAGLDSGLSGGALPLPAQPVAGALPVTPAAVATPDPGASASHGVLGGMPMTGGISSQAGHERHRDSWASEDRNLWGLPDACVPPLIEGD